MFKEKIINKSNRTWLIIYAVTSILTGAFALYLHYNEQRPKTVKEFVVSYLEDEPENWKETISRDTILGDYDVQFNEHITYNNVKRCIKIVQHECISLYNSAAYKFYNHHQYLPTEIIIAEKDTIMEIARITELTNADDNIDNAIHKYLIKPKEEKAIEELEKKEQEKQQRIISHICK